MGIFDHFSKKASADVKDGMKVKDIMTSNPIVVLGTVSIAQIEEIFYKNRIWSIFVGDHNKYIGVITRNDLKFRTRNKQRSSPAFSIMSNNVISIDENADVEDAKNLLYNKKINSLAVTRNGKHCGIITRYDIKTKGPNSSSHPNDQIFTNEDSIPSDNNQLIRTLIIELENNSDIDIRNSAATQLGSFREPSVVNALIKCVKNDPKVRYRALVALRNIGDSLAIPVFIERSKDPSARIRLVSVNALGELGDSTVIKDLESVIKSKDYQNTLKYGRNPEIIQAAKDAKQKICSKYSSELQLILSVDYTQFSANKSHKLGITVTNPSTSLIFPP
jgi:CBS domain-containing protein